MKYCPNCNQHYDGNFCPECGSPLIDSPAEGFKDINLSLGDANAISGGINLSDSHNVSNVDNSVHHNSTVNNITNVQERQKTEKEILQEKKNLYLAECKRAFEDNILEQDEVVALEGLRLRIGLDKIEADRILDSVRKLSERSARKQELNPLAKIKLKQLTASLENNEIKALMDQIDNMEVLVNRFTDDELHRKFYLVLAALKCDVCIQSYETNVADNYWQSYWTYMAYLKTKCPEKAFNVLQSLDKYGYPEANIILLGAAGEILQGNVELANSYLEAMEGEYSPALQRFADSIYLLLDPVKAVENGATEESCAFYLVNFFNQQDPRERAAEEARRQAEAEAKARAIAEAEAKAEAIRLAEEEARKREEEERLARKIEEAKEVLRRKEKEEKEALLRKIEEEKESLRRKVTYSVIIEAVNNSTLAKMNLRRLFNISFTEADNIFNALPYIIKTFTNSTEASSLMYELTKGGIVVGVNAINGLNEEVSTNIRTKVERRIRLERQQKAEEEVREYYEAERRKKEEEERKAYEKAKEEQKTKQDSYTYKTQFSLDDAVSTFNKVFSEPQLEVTPTVSKLWITQDTPNVIRLNLHVHSSSNNVPCKYKLIITTSNTKFTKDDTGIAYSCETEFNLLDNISILDADYENAYCLSEEYFSNLKSGEFCLTTTFELMDLNGNTHSKLSCQCTVVHKIPLFGKNELELKN